MTIENLGGGLDITDPAEIASPTQPLGRLLAVTRVAAGALCRTIAAESPR